MDQNISRKDFLKLLGLGGAGLAVGGLGFLIRNNLNALAQNATGSSTNGTLAPGDREGREPAARIPRNLRKPSNPQATALLLNLLARHAANAPDKTQYDMAIELALENIPNSRQIANNIIQNFQSIPLPTRTQFFGNFANITSRAFPLQQYNNVFRGLISPKVSLPTIEEQFRPDQLDLMPPRPNVETFDPNIRNQTPQNTRPSSEYSGSPTITPISGVPPPAAPPQQPVPPPAAPPQQYRLQYTGLFCLEETDWDRASDEDEPFVIASIIYEDSRGRQIVRSSRRIPTRNWYYQEVDSGDYRNGPVVTVYSGPARELTLVATVMEGDADNPENDRARINEVLAAAAAIAKEQVESDPQKNGIDVLSSLFSDAIVWAIGSENDIIEEAYTTLSASRIANLGRTTPRRSTGGMYFHFRTKHSGDGARYRAYFRVRRQ